MAFLSLAHADLGAQGLRGLHKAQEVLKLRPGIVTVNLDDTSQIVQEVIHFLLNQLEIGVARAPFAHLHSQLLNLIVFLRHDRLVLVALFDQVTDQNDVLADLLLVVLLVSDQIKYAPLIVLGLTREELLLCVRLIVSDLELVDGFA